MRKHSGLHQVPRKYFRNYQQYRGMKIRCFCSAPFVSMRIGIGGHVYACNHNSSFLLGKWPESSLQEIWNGENIRILRKWLKKNDFSLGCATCLKDILRGRYDAGSFTLFDKYEWREWPSMLDFRMSNECNLQCIMCSGLSSSKFREEQKVRKFDWSADFYEQLDAFIPHLTTARFIGGEPFFIPEYYKIWEHIVRINPACDIVVQTNATLLNDRIRPLLGKGRFHISISFDSLKKETYEAIRVYADFEKVMSNIQQFTQYTVETHTNLTLCFCPMRMNYKEIPAFIEFSNAHQAMVCLNHFLYPAHLAIWSLPQKEINAILAFLKQYRPDTSHQTATRNAAFFTDYLNLLREWADMAGKRVQQEVTAGALEALIGPIISYAEQEEDLADKLHKVFSFQDKQRLYWYLRPIQENYSPRLFCDFLATADTDALLRDISSLALE